MNSIDFSTSLCMSPKEAHVNFKHLETNLGPE